MRTSKPQPQRTTRLPVGAPIKIARSQLKKALMRSMGNRSAAARMLGCHHLTVCRAIERWPEMRQVEIDARKQFCDLAMSKLVIACNNGEPWAVKEVLRRTGHLRDFTEVTRQEITGAYGRPIATVNVNVQLTYEQVRALSDDDLNRLLDGDTRPLALAPASDDVAGREGEAA